MNFVLRAVPGYGAKCGAPAARDPQTRARRFRHFRRIFSFCLPGIARNGVAMTPHLLPISTSSTIYKDTNLLYLRPMLPGMI